MPFAANEPVYALVTAASNEEAVIEHTLRSVVSQTRLPRRWIIVSDCSTDRTVEIVAQYAKAYEFIRLLRITEPHTRNFAAQIRAINMGLGCIKGVEYQFIGNLDADIGLQPEYFETLLERFRRDSSLGLAGGYICDRQSDGSFQSRARNSVRSVAHAVQMFRRRCFESVQAYQPLPYGGADTHAEVSARMNGWTVRSFPDLQVLHYRPTGTASGALRNSFRQGLMDFSVGYDPLYEIFKILARISLQRPLSLAYAVMRVAGFAQSYLNRRQRPVSTDFVAFLRKEQRERIYSTVLHPWRIIQKHGI